MKVDKDKRRVAILVREQAVVRGYIHINPGERTLDFLNDARKTFIAVTDAEFQAVASIRSFKLYTDRTKRTKVVIISKSDIKWVEEL
jgi:hypothetical protein